MTEQLSLIPPEEDPAAISLEPGEHLKIDLKAAIEQRRKALADVKTKHDLVTTGGDEALLGYGPSDYRSLGPGWVEDPEGNVVPPENGELYDTNPESYILHMSDLVREAATRAGIAACREAVWQSWLKANGWEEPNWDAIRAEANYCTTAA
jgi:hypothetical protein